MKKVRLDDSVLAIPGLWSVILLLVHCQLELHFRIVNRIIHQLVVVVCAHLRMLLEKVLRRVILLGGAAQAVSLSFSWQITQWRHL